MGMVLIKRDFVFLTLYVTNSIDSGTVYLKGLMMSKYFVFNADKFGVSKEHNKAILEGYNNGFLSSATIIANGEAFSAAVNDILPECPTIGLGINLNITSNKALTKCSTLTNNKGFFNGNYINIFLCSFNKNTMKEIEKEFRAQIERVRQHSNITHITSTQYIHTIPKIFELVAKLSAEYNIPVIRTFNEKIFFVEDISKSLNLYFPFNLLRSLFLNLLTHFNKKALKKYNLKTNNYISGLEYANILDANLIEEGLKSIELEDCIVEMAISTCDTTTSNLTLDRKLEDSIKRLGFQITNYKNIC